jgi:putative membrane protein
MPDPTNWEKSQIKEPIVRDVMAIERTIMANERTFLAFWRTALTMFIAGLTFLQFFAGTVMQVIGWIFIPTGVVVFLQGLRIYRRMNSVIQRAEQAVENENGQEKS